MISKTVLYCVIDEFFTEYDLRLLEEEERAEIVAKKRLRKKFCSKIFAKVNRLRKKA